MSTQISNGSILDRLVSKIRKPDIWLRETKLNGKHALTKISDADSTIVFQFAENIFDTSKIHTFIYQDLSVSYIEYMMDNMPEVYAVSAFQGYPSKSIRKRALYQNKYYEDCSGIFTMGRWLANDMISRCKIDPSKVHPVGGGINLDRRLIIDTNKTGNKILFVGRDFARKGGYIVVNAFKELKKRRGNIELYVAGPKVDPVTENIDGYHFMGDCDYKKTAELFNMCDVFCMPSYFEAYGLVFVEALSFGLPVIARNAYEMPYLIDNGVTGLLLEEDDKDCLADMMEQVLEDASFKENVHSRHDFYLSEYSWSKVAERIHEVIG